MTTDPDRIEELANVIKWLDTLAKHNLQTNGNFHYKIPKEVGEWAELLRPLSAELAEARTELKRHLTSSVEYDLVDGIRQLAQVALTNKGNVETLETYLAELRQANIDLQEVIDDSRRLTRELDVAMHGEANAAKQASLCDLIVPAEQLRQAKESLDWLIARKYIHIGYPVCYEAETAKPLPDLPPYLKSRLEGK